MSGYQPIRCTKHNLIADVVTKFSSKQFACPFAYELLQGQSPTNCVTIPHSDWFFTEIIVT